MSYTPGRVWSILIGAPCSVEEAMDLRSGLMEMPTAEHHFLVLLAQGHTAATSMAVAGLTGNQSRVKAEALRKLTRYMNGGRGGNTVSPDQQRTAIRKDYAG